MTGIAALRQKLPDFARDVRLNVGSILSPGGAPVLTDKQIWGVAVAAAIASRNGSLMPAIESVAAEVLDSSTIEAAGTAASIMSMTNIYYPRNPYGARR
ncbi:hypothetical protein [Rhodopseudomonas pseudopalustris]|uniref:Alkyl hydroperoxide reductase subunit D n=1 Tax=Rhodopseudomonas pseudopalustris TaxID=1513892 RepID=A0A1H8XBZ1_9BRAD|nr:hypothetical protein [Rhodopseudomonas pseudopalustris]SEP37257.1 alkyl hydroperoxide reductase subunit D [Rhodopseudomonas pseudopalustris]